LNFGKAESPVIRNGEKGCWGFVKNVILKKLKYPVFLGDFTVPCSVIIQQLFFLNGLLFLFPFYFFSGEKVEKSRCSNATRAHVQRKPHPSKIFFV